MLLDVLELHSGPGGYTLLHYAVEGGSRNLVKLLLDDGMGFKAQQKGAPKQ